MAFSIESRVPFLTSSLAKFHLTLPGHYIFIPNGTSKAVFRRAMRGIVPAQILDRRDKVGFPTPEREWLLAQRSFVERVLSGGTARRFEGLRVNGIVQEWENTIQGRQKLDTRA